MECPLCRHQKPHKHGKTSKGTQRYYCPKCKQTFTETFDTLYYRRQIEAELAIAIPMYKIAELAIAPWNWNNLITYPTLCALHYHSIFVEQ